MTHPRLARTCGESATRTARLERIRVVLADDHELIRRSLRLLLEGEDGFEVVAEADDLASVVREARRRRPHVLVLDLRMSNGSSVDIIERVKALAPDTRIVALTMDDSPALARRAIARGALGYVLKQQADGELPLAVRAAARDEEFISPRVAARLDSLRRSVGAAELTAREVEILRLIVLGHTSVEIAGKLSISPRTVESHRARVHSKLGLVTRAELVSYALGRGLLSV